MDPGSVRGDGCGLSRLRISDCRFSWILLSLILQNRLTHSCFARFCTAKLELPAAIGGTRLDNLASVEPELRPLADRMAGAMSKP